MSQLDAKLLRTARTQKWALWTLLAALLLQLAFFTVRSELSSSNVLLLIVLMLAMNVALIGLMATMFVNMGANAWLTAGFAILLIVPVVNLFVMLAANARTTKHLREAGLHVGFMGVPPKEMARLKEAELNPPPSVQT